MARKLTGQWLIPVLVLLSAVGQGMALEKIDAERYQAACRSYAGGDSDDGVALCAGFLLGYLSAAERFDAGGESDGGYHSRALETRAKGLIFKDKCLKGNRYCVPESEPLERIVSRINEVAVDREPAPFAENLVEIVLDQYYRCAD